MKLTAETLIASDQETVWRLSQTPELHARWDVRFTDIEYLPRATADEPQRFRYTTRIGFGLAIQGWGATVGSFSRTRSALRFGSTDPRSLIREGAGSWTYGDRGGAVSFSTIYDYATRYGLIGRILDLLFRPLMIWATRWSFDRLRIWIENGIRPEIALRLWIVKVVVRCALAVTWIYEGLVPKILFQRADEIALVQASALWLGTPSQSLAALGVAEIAFGLWLLSARAERIAAILSTVGICSLASLAVSIQPAALADPFGGISKNLGLVACGLAVWMLSEYSPMALRAKPVRRHTSKDPARSPFAQALGDRLHDAAPLVRAHVAPAIGVHRYEGVMTKIWRADGPRRWLTAPFLRVGCWMDTLFPETGKDIPFVILNRLFVGADGATCMSFERRFCFPGVERLFHATMRYEASSNTIFDVLGMRRHLLVELVPAIEQAGITVRSRRQWLTPFGLPLRIRLPRVVAGEATIQEWQEGNAALGIRVTISNRLFGPFFGYEGIFRPVE
jgi:hypothetical protein